MKVDIVTWIADFIRERVLEEDVTFSQDSEEEDQETSPVIVFLDNTYYMDIASWQLLE